MKIFIVKFGALGDVVRTSYFAKALKTRFGAETHITWITAPVSSPLLKFNPYIDRVITDFSDVKHTHFDHVFSLDDEREILIEVTKIDASVLTGAYLDDGVATYTDDAAPWFDMGLLSRHGKDRADELKKINTRGHSEIFSEIFDVPSVQPEFYGDPLEEQHAHTLLGEGYFTVAINPFAGGRWPSKELRHEELDSLIGELFSRKSPNGLPMRVMLLGAGLDYNKNREVSERFSGRAVLAPNTDASILRLAAVIRYSDVLISSDSLALHLGIGQKKPFVAFFAPTSAAEIDDFGLGVKLKSTSSDYCSYRKDADNGSITAARIMECFNSLIK